MAEQYFSADPSSKDVRRTLHVQLRGRDTDVEVSNGVFSGSRLDLGTSVLLKQAPEPPEHGNLLDLGCGWGPIALSLAFASPEATVWAADVNERALELTELNAKRNGCGNVRVIRTDADAKPVDPTALSPDLTFDAIWSNPPIRIGKPALHDLLLEWTARLAPEGTAALVVGKNLGADPLARWLGEQLPDREVAKVASAKGFRVLEVGPVRPG